MREPELRPLRVAIVVASLRILGGQAVQAQRARLGQPLEDAILKVVRSGAYIMGPEIAEFEELEGDLVQGFEVVIGERQSWDAAEGLWWSDRMLADAESMPFSDERRASRLGA